jgi:HSP20 family molecular chaperone IbpA
MTDTFDKMIRNMMDRFDRAFRGDFFDFSFGLNPDDEEDEDEEKVQIDDDGEKGKVHPNIKERHFGYEIVSGSNMKEPIVRIFGNPDDFPELKKQLEGLMNGKFDGTFSLPGMEDSDGTTPVEITPGPEGGEVKSEEPFSETYTGEDGSFIASIDLPGIKEEEVSISIDGHSVIIKAANDRRNFKKVLDLDFKPVEKNITKAINNGMLEVKIKKK